MNCRCFSWVMFLMLLVAPFGASADESSLAESLSKQVTIHRDEYGVPHIVAETDEAAIFGYGYAVAEDHAEDIARLMIKGRAEEAKYFGEKFMDADFETLQLGVYEGAISGYAKTMPWYQRILDAYALGYNRYIERHKNELAEWVKPISGIDVLAHSRRVTYVEFALNRNQVKQVALEQTEKLKATETSETEKAPGSNMIAINRERSASGKAMLMGNPHLAWSGSHIWHELHLYVPGKVNAYGACLIGSPGISIGFNEHLGWSHTVNPHDADDIYELSLSPDDPGSYMYDGRPIAFTEKTLTIQVKNEDGSLREETKTVIYAHQGPVMAQVGTKAYALRSPNEDQYRHLEQWFRMTHSKSYEEFYQALEIQAIPMFNICYADVEGNCFYIFNGRFPVRPTGYDWSGVVPGDISATDYDAILPIRALPQLFNPPGGYVHNSNSAPWYTNLNQIIDKNKFPEYMCGDENSLRSQIALDMLEADDSITFQELLDMKNTMRLLLAERVKADLLRALENSGDAKIEAARVVLEKWDGRAAKDSAGAVLFTNFWNEYKRNAKQLWAVDWSAEKPASTPYGLGSPEIALSAMKECLDRMTSREQPIDMPWGDLNRIQEGAKDVAVGGHTGEFGAYRILYFGPGKDKKMAAQGGDSFVFGVEFTNPPHAVSVLPYGETNVPGSPHDDDQVELFANEEWKTVHFGIEDVMANAKRSYHP